MNEKRHSAKNHEWEHTSCITSSKPAFLLDLSSRLLPFTLQIDSYSDSKWQKIRTWERSGTNITSGNPTITLFQQIKEFIDAFLKDSLHVRVKLDNGTTFIGPMTRQFIREDTHSFIFKYGKEAQEGWTMLAQISSAPMSDNKLKKLQDFVDTLTSVQAESGTILDMFNPIIEFVYGLQEAVASVSYPSIAVTPIAIYRELNSLR